jgi:1,4-dihydroxy-2-naphthoate octaprenyltransferase
MNFFKKMIPAVLIFIGLGCLTVAGSILYTTHPFHHFFQNFIGIVSFMLLPMVMLFVYFILSRRK